MSGNVLKFFGVLFVGIVCYGLGGKDMAVAMEKHYVCTPREAKK